MRCYLGFICYTFGTFLLLGAERIFKHTAGTKKGAVHCWRWLWNNSQHICLFQPGFSTGKHMYGSHKRPFITETRALPTVLLQFSVLFFFFFFFLKQAKLISMRNKTKYIWNRKDSSLHWQFFLSSPKRAKHRRTVTQICSRHDAERAPSVLRHSLL